MNQGYAKSWVSFSFVLQDHSQMYEDDEYKSSKSEL